MVGRSLRSRKYIFTRLLYGFQQPIKTNFTHYAHRRLARSIILWDPFAAEISSAPVPRPFPRAACCSFFGLSLQRYLQAGTLQLPPISKSISLLRTQPLPLQRTLLTLEKGLTNICKQIRFYLLAHNRFQEPHQLNYSTLQYMLLPTLPSRAVSVLETQLRSTLFETETWSSSSQSPTF